MFTPVRDSLGNNVIPGQQGEFLINVENAYFFMVNGYNKDPDLAYFCSEIQKAQLYHCGKGSMLFLSILELLDFTLE